MMNGFIKRTLSVMGFAGMLMALNGCAAYREVVDTCYPERYWHSSRNAVNASFAPQVRNGHILDQTVWNHHFEKGSETLTGAGQDKLALLARRRPHPDTMLFLQTAQDIEYDEEKPQEFVQQRLELNQKRIASIQKYLSAQTSGRGLAFQVVVHDPSEVGQAAVPVGNAVLQMYATPTATLPGSGFISSVTGGGGAGGQ